MDHSLLSFAGAALLQILTGTHLLFLVTGVLVGIVVGILPGMGGISGLALIMPFVYGLDQGAALAMMIGLTAVTTVSDTFPSILLGIPGSAGSQATILDGFPLAKKGEAARALSASFSASLMGGIFGALILTCSFVFARPVLLAIGFGEQLMLVILALTLVGMLTGDSMIKGLASCGLGLLIGTIGAAPATAEYRLTLGTLYLTDGIPLVVVGLGVFAIPEILEVLRHQRSVATKSTIGTGWWQGVRDTIEHKWLVLRCSAIGAVIGALPGLGGTVIEWVSYGHGLQTAKDKSQFGKGDIRGVIAPEAANNAKEGGALIPTLFFGIPGSGSMALLLGGFVLIGLTPGRTMVNDHVDLVYLIIWSLAIAHVIGAVICVLLARPISAVAAVPYTMVAPFMIVLIYFAGFQATRDWGDIVAMLALGVIGILLKRFGWSRPALLIGFVLSKPLEAALYRTVQIYGFDVLLRPLSLGLLAIALVSGFYAWRSKSKVSETSGTTTGASSIHRRDQIIFATAVALVVAYSLVSNASLRFLGSVFPLSTAAITLVLTLAALALMAFKREAHHLLFDSEAEYRARGVTGVRPMPYYFAWLILLAALAWVFGFFIAAPLYVIIFIMVLGREPWQKAVIGAMGTVILLTVIRDVLLLNYPQGLLEQWLDLPDWLS